MSTALHLQPSGAQHRPATPSSAQYQLVPGRDNIGDVGLQTFKQVLLNKLQLNIIKFTNFRPKMAAFSLKTFRLFFNSLWTPNIWRISRFVFNCEIKTFCSCGKYFRNYSNNVTTGILKTKWRIYFVKENNFQSIVIFFFWDGLGFIGNWAIKTVLNIHNTIIIIL